MQLRMHLVQAVAVQKAHQSHQILALNPSKLASVPWSRYVQVFSFTTPKSSKKVDESIVNDDMI